MLGEIGDPRAVEPLIRLVSTGQLLFVGDNLVEALRNFGAPAIQLLIKALGEGNLAAAEALGEIGDKRAVEPLIKALGDDDPLVRDHAASALGEIGDKRAVEPLIKVLEDDVSDVRMWAAYALGEIGDKRAVGPLIKALGDEDDNSSYAARYALREFGVQGLQGFITAGQGEELIVPELKMILKEKKLPTSGTKALLIQRIVDAK